MAITIGSNIASLLAQRKLGQSSAGVAKTYERLSSGLRINHASDDAAGLAISSNLNSAAQVFSQAVRNVNDAVSAANIAEGALNELKNVSLRQRELATQAANGTYSVVQRRALNREANALVDEFNRIVSSTSFNGMSLFDPNLGTLSIQAGVGNNARLDLGFSSSLTRPVGDGTFSAGIDAGADCFQPIAGDFNNDGKLDFIAGDVGNNNLRAYLGNGDGTFSISQTISAANGSGYGGYGTTLVTADFNGDGRLDFATTEEETGRIMTYLGNGNGTFQSARIITAPTVTRSLAVGDFNNDGRMDMAVTGGNLNAIFLGNSGGSFTLAAIMTVVGDSGPYGMAAADYSIAVGDFNNDSNLDVASVNGSGIVTVFLGAGNGTFGGRQSLTVATVFVDGRPNTTFTDFIAAADFNRDGNLDLLTGDDNGDASYVILGNGNGTFLSPKIISGSDQAVSIADINGDGIPDIVGGYATFFGNGDGTFKTGLSTQVLPLLNNALAIADFNGDGRLDLLANDSSVYLGNGSRVSSTPYLNICSAQGARDAMSVIDGTLDRISAQLGLLGASTSRFGVAIHTLTALSENYRAAASRITDADIAEEAAALARQQILEQAGAAILAQANQQPSIALQLLRL